MSSYAGLKTRDKPLRVGVDCRPFHIFRCQNQGCRAPLCDTDGNPRWDLLEGRFVCLQGCRMPQRPGAARKAVLS